MLEHTSTSNTLYFLYLAHSLARLFSVACALFSSPRGCAPSYFQKIRLAMEELFEEETGKAAGVVANDGVFLEKIVEDHAEAELL